MADRAPSAVSGRVDPDGFLTAADAPLVRLQEEAGSRLGRPLAVPQLAAIARLAHKLGVPVSRPAIAGLEEGDLELWVRAEPDDGSVRLTIDGWVLRPPRGPRWPVRAAVPAAPPERRFRTDSALRIIDPVSTLGLDPQPPAALTRLFRLDPDVAGDMPLLTAAAARAAFAGQPARMTAEEGEGEPVLLSGTPIIDEDGHFAGFDIRVLAAPPADAPPAAAPPAAAPTSSPAAADPAAFDSLLRQPLDQIIAQAQAIAGRSDGPLRSNYAAYADDIASAGNHLLGVLRAMGKEPLPSDSRVDLARLAAEAANLVQPQANARRVRIVVDGEHALSVRGQARAITQILVNLIGNAARFSHAGGVVNVTVRAGSDASVTVSDTGPGVPAADRTRIFERFEQAEPRGEGAGLGLAISRRLARSIGGDVVLDEGAAQGASFKLRLPRD